MKKLIITLLFFPIWIFGQDLKKSAYFSKETTVYHPVNEEYNKKKIDTKIEIDFELMLIYVKFSDKEHVYAFSGISNDEESNKMFFELKSDEFKVLVIGPTNELNKYNLMLVPEKLKTENSILFNSALLLYASK